jgi:hypothetical protein
MSNEEPDFIPFPELPDEAVIALSEFLETFIIRFQNRYFAQIHRYYNDRPTSREDYGDSMPPLSDPPF